MSSQTSELNQSTRLIPGPKGHFFSGSARELIADPLGFINGLADTYGPVVRFKAFTNSFLLVSDPNLVREVLVTQAANFPKDKRDIEILSRMLGFGLVTTNGEAHKRQRRLTQPAFHSKRIDAYAGTMVAYTLAMIDDWQINSLAASMTLDINEAMRELTLYIVARTLFGADRVTMKETADRVGQAIHILQDITNKEFQSPVVWPEWLPTSTNRRRRKAAAVLYETIDSLIAERRATVIDGQVADTGDLLSMLLISSDDTGDAMSDAEVRDQLVTLFVAGHETTSNALTWTWYLLSQHPAEETKLYQEVDRVLGGRPPTLADLPTLPFTLRVIKEAMRLYPPAWVLNNRWAAEDTMLGDYPIRHGELIWLSPYVNHRRPQFFPDPERFHPDRWTPEFEKALPKFAYMPFGGGPRVCIGNSFALMEAQLIVATMAQRAHLRLAPGQVIEPNPQVTLSNKGGMQMIVESRTSQPVNP
ncbi:MAG: cytochrome P450 [Chloroflexota bacterium]|jgi:cytochrome P450